MPEQDEWEQSEEQIEISYDIMMNTMSMLNLQAYHKHQKEKYSNMEKPDSQFPYFDGFEGFGFSMN